MPMRTIITIETDDESQGFLDRLAAVLSPANGQLTSTQTPPPKRAPKTTVTEDKPAEEPKEERMLTAKEQAIKLLAAKFTKREDRAKLDTLLSQFGHKRFGEIPDDRGEELLAAVKELIG